MDYFRSLTLALGVLSLLLYSCNESSTELKKDTIAPSINAILVPSAMDETSEEQATNDDIEFSVEGNSTPLNRDQSACSNASSRCQDAEEDFDDAQDQPNMELMIDKIKDGIENLVQAQDYLNSCPCVNAGFRIDDAMEAANDALKSVTIEEMKENADDAENYASNAASVFSSCFDDN